MGKKIETRRKLNQVKVYLFDMINPISLFNDVNAIDIRIRNCNIYIILDKTGQNVGINKIYLI